MKRIIISTLVTLGLIGGVFIGSAAAGTAAFSLSPASGTYAQGSSFTVGVSEDAQANVVTAKLTYDASKLQCNGASNSFGTTIAASCGGGSVTISGFAAGGTTASGPVGSISFTVLNTGSTSVTFAAGSQIANNGVNLWNGSAAGGTYTLTGAVAPVAGGSTGGSTGSGGSTSSSAKTGAASVKAATATTSVTTTTTGAAVTDSSDNNGVVKAASVTAVTKKTTEPQAKNTLLTDNNTAAWILAGLLVLGLGILAYLRREQLGALIARIRNKFSSKPAAKTAKTAATAAVSSKATTKTTPVKK